MGGFGDPASTYRARESSPSSGCCAQHAVKIRPRLTQPSPGYTTGLPHLTSHHLQQRLLEDVSADQRERLLHRRVVQTQGGAHLTVARKASNNKSKIKPNQQSRGTRKRGLTRRQQSTHLHVKRRKGLCNPNPSPKRNVKVSNVLPGDKWKTGVCGGTKMCQLEFEYLECHEKAGPPPEWSPPSQFTLLLLFPIEP